MLPPALVNGVSGFELMKCWLQSYFCLQSYITSNPSASFLCLNLEAQFSRAATKEDHKWEPHNSRNLFFHRPSGQKSEIQVSQATFPPQVLGGDPFLPPPAPGGPGIPRPVAAWLQRLPVPSHGLLLSVCLNRPLLFFRKTADIGLRTQPPSRMTLSWRPLT